MWRGFRHQVPPLRPANEEVTIKEDHARDRRNTLGIIQTLFDMLDEGLRAGNTVEYFRDLMRRKHDDMRSTTTCQISRTKRHWLLEKTIVLCLLDFGSLIVNN